MAYNQGDLCVKQSPAAETVRNARRKNIVIIEKEV